MSTYGVDGQFGSTEELQLTPELGVMLTGAAIAFLLREDPAILEGVGAAIPTRMAAPRREQATARDGPAP